MNGQQMEYKIIQTETLEQMENITNYFIVNGWQPAGPVTELTDNSSAKFYHEMVRFQTDTDAQQQREQQIQAERQAFMEKLDTMDAKVKDLLEINGIVLMYVDGKLYTQIGDKVSEGIQPQEVLKALKKSKHYPIDMPDDTVLNAIEGVI